MNDDKYISTTQLGKIYNINAKLELFNHLIALNFLTYSQKKYWLTELGLNYGKYIQLENGDKFVAWNENKISSIMHNYKQSYLIKLEQKFSKTALTQCFEDVCKEQVNYFQRYLHASFNYSNYSQRTSRCTLPLKTEKDLINYMALYGLPHFQKMTNLFQIFWKYGSFKTNQEIDATVVDFGCGQGIATIALLQYLHQQNIAVKKLNIVLIEPSELAIQRAKGWIRNFSLQYQFDIEIKELNMNVQDVPSNFLAEYNVNTLIHLYANFLDLAGVGLINVDQVYSLTRYNKGEHYHFAMSPYYLYAEDAFKELNMLINNENTYLTINSLVDVNQFSFKSNCWLNEQRSMVTLFSNYTV